MRVMEIFFWRIRIRADGTVLTLSQWLSEPKELVQEVAFRAGLGRVRESWLDTVYTRAE
jgi:hypothetical protein